MSAKRILLIWGDIRGVGGTERRMGEISAEFVRRQFSVTSFALANRDDLPLQLVQRSAGATTSHSRSLRELRRVWRAFDPDLVIAFGMRASLASRTLRAVGTRARVVVMARNGLDFGWSPWMHVIDRLSSPLVSVYLANSRRVAQHLTERGIRPGRIAIVTSALDASWLAPTVPRDGPPVIAMIGNARPEKNHLFGVDAFLRMREEATLRVYTNNGDSIRRHLIEHASPEKTGSVIIIEDHVITPTDLDAVDVLLHPSLSESLPRTVLEASARGCRIVASDAGDTRHYVSSSDGVVLTAFDEGEYAAALDNALRRGRHRGGEVRDHVDSVEDYVDELLSACGLQK